MAPKTLKIIWAIDAFMPEDMVRDKMIQLLKSLTSKAPAKIIPVYILSPDQLNLSIEFSGVWINHYRPSVEKSLTHVLKDTGLKTEEPKIIIKDTPSLKNGVKSLAAYAASVGADLIVTGTHGRKGVTRLILGSFAETLLLYSKVPVLIVGSEAKVPAEFHHILFATDLEHGTPALNPVIGLAKMLQAKVTLLHTILNPVEPVLQSGVYLLGGGWVSVPVYLQKEKERKLKLAETLAEKARRKGVDVEVVVDGAANSVTQSVLDHADRHHATLIAMAAHSGPVASAVIGSITRQVARHSHCPVWVIREKLKK